MESVRVFVCARVWVGSAGSVAPGGQSVWYWAGQDLVFGGALYTLFPSHCTLAAATSRPRVAALFLITRLFIRVKLVVCLISRSVRLTKPVCRLHDIGCRFPHPLYCRRWASRNGTKNCSIFALERSRYISPILVSDLNCWMRNFTFSDRQITSLWKSHHDSKKVQNLIWHFQ